MTPPKLYPRIAIDPGQTTGIAVRFVDGTWETSECRTLIELVERLDHKFETIIVERFDTNGRISHDGIHTVELVGAIKAMAHKHGSGLIQHQPQARLAFKLNAREMLKPLGRFASDHEQDALMHLIAYEIRGN